MASFRSIVCPVDFSAHARRALRTAVGLARDFEARLTVVHALDLPVQLYGVPTVHELLAAARERAEREMSDLRARVDLSQARVVTDEGRPDTVVLEAIRQSEADLVVMGTHGLAGFQRLFLGSVTERILHLATIPLLAVPIPPGGDDGPDARLPFRRIVVGSDLSGHSRHTMDLALEVAGRYDSDLIAVHAFQVPWYPPELGPGGWLSEDELATISERIAAQRREQLTALTPTTPPGVTVTCRVMDAAPAEGVLQAASESDADLIVVGAHGHGRSDLNWIGSTCQRVIRASTRPVLAVREAS